MNSFEETIKACMRADPDIILIGEIQDYPYIDYIEIAEHILNNNLNAIKKKIIDNTTDGIIEKKLIQHIIYQLTLQCRIDMLILIFEEFESAKQIAITMLDKLYWLSEQNEGFKQLEAYFVCEDEKNVISHSMDKHVERDKSKLAEKIKL